MVGKNKTSNFSKNIYLKTLLFIVNVFDLKTKLNINKYFNMSKIDLIGINLSKPNATYVTGEVISGNLSVRITERIKVNCIKVIIGGTVEVLLFSKLI